VFVPDNDKEYGRFLPEGLREIFKDFDAIEVILEGNSVAGFFRTVNVFLVSFARPRFLVPVLEWTVVPFLNLPGYLLAGLGRANDLFTANFSVWASK
jgi:hypothetical protein